MCEPNVSLIRAELEPLFIRSKQMTTQPTRMINRLLFPVAVAALLTSSVACATGARDSTRGAQGGVITDLEAQSSQGPTVDATGDDTELSMEQVLAKLKEQGYSDITEIGREGDQYCVEARDSNGKKVEKYVDAKTGEIVNKDEAALSKDVVIERVKEQGYPEVSKIEREGDRYWVMARDAEGKKFELHVSSKTGEILRKERMGK